MTQQNPIMNTYYNRKGAVSKINDMVNTVKKNFSGCEIDHSPESYGFDYKYSSRYYDRIAIQYYQGNYTLALFKENNFVENEALGYLYGPKQFNSEEEVINKIKTMMKILTMKFRLICK